MSLSSENMMKLMAYADGELEGVERTEAEMLLASNGDAVSFIEQVAGLGELVELGHESRSGKAIRSFDVADAVMAGIQVSRGSAPRTPEISTLAGARERRSNALKIGAGIVAVVALAASVFVFAQHRSEEVPMATARVLAVQPTDGVPGTGVAIESAGESVSVFYLPTANELSTSVVVWVDETGEK